MYYSWISFIAMIPFDTLSPCSQDCYLAQKAVMSSFFVLCVWCPKFTHVLTQLHAASLDWAPRTPVCMLHHNRHLLFDARVLMKLGVTLGLGVLISRCEGNWRLQTLVICHLLHFFILRCQQLFNWSCMNDRYFTIFWLKFPLVIFCFYKMSCYLFLGFLV